MDNEELELLKWACPKDCPNRCAKEIDGKLVSCHFSCERYLKSKEIKDKHREQEKEQRAINRSSWSDFDAKKTFRNRTKR